MYQSIVLDCGEVNKPDSNSSSSQSTTEYEAYRNPIPWSVRIYGKIKNEFLMICGGTLISTNLVVTGIVNCTNYENVIYLSKSSKSIVIQ